MCVYVCVCIHDQMCRRVSVPRIHIVASSGRVDTEVDKHIAQASKAFGALRRAVFSDGTLYVETKTRVYQACVLSILLCGSECWTPLQRQLRKLDSFHHRYIRTILHLDLDGEQCTARQCQRNVRRDSTKLAPRCNVNSASESLERKGIRKGTSAFLKDRSRLANSVVQPSALHARDGSAAMAEGLSTDV